MSEPAILVVSGVIPIELQVLERSLLHTEKERLGKHMAAITVRSRIIRMWQEKWDAETRGRWTARLIPKLETWIGRRHGEVNYYLTQMLTGHGHFQAFLFKIGKVINQKCLYCESPSDTALHTFFECERWKHRRDMLIERLGSISPDTIVHTMLQSEESWTSVNMFVESILRQKQHDASLA